MFGLGKKPADPPAFEPWDVLVGLAPSLVEDLAQLVGSTEEDLLVSFQVMPYGNRATLAAYGLIEMDKSPGGRRRVVSVSPAAVELVNSASEFLAESNDQELADADEPAHLQRAHLLASAAVPWVHVVSNPVDATGVPVRGVVVAVDPDRVRVRVPLLTSDADDAVEVLADDIQISPEHEIGGPGTHVVLSYDSVDAPLGLPRAVAIDEELAGT